MKQQLIVKTNKQLKIKKNKLIFLFLYNYFTLLGGIREKTWQQH